MQVQYLGRDLGAIIEFADLRILVDCPLHTLLAETVAQDLHYAQEVLRHESPSSVCAKQQTTLINDLQQLLRVALECEARGVCRYYGVSPQSVDMKSIDAVLISNHESLLGLPHLVVDTGFQGLVYCTEPTFRFGELALQDMSGGDSFSSGEDAAGGTGAAGAAAAATASTSGVAYSAAVRLSGPSLSSLSSSAVNTLLDMFESSYGLACKKSDNMLDVILDASAITALPSPSLSRLATSPPLSSPVATFTLCSTPTREAIRSALSRVRVLAMNQPVIITSAASTTSSSTSSSLSSTASSHEPRIYTASTDASISVTPVSSSFSLGACNWIFQSPPAPARAGGIIAPAGDCQRVAVISASSSSAKRHPLPLDTAAIAGASSVVLLDCLRRLGSNSPPSQHEQQQNPSSLPTAQSVPTSNPFSDALLPPSLSRLPLFEVPPPDQQLTHLCSQISSLLHSGSRVLLPCEAANVCLDLLHYLGAHLHAAGLPHVPLYLLAPSAGAAMGAAAVFSEYLYPAKRAAAYEAQPCFSYEDLIRLGRLVVAQDLFDPALAASSSSSSSTSSVTSASFSSSGSGPSAAFLSLFHARPLASRKALGEEPCVVFCASASLQFGPSLDLLEAWGVDPSTALVCTDPAFPSHKVLPGAMRRLYWRHMKRRGTGKGLGNAEKTTQLSHTQSITGSTSSSSLSSSSSYTTFVDRYRQLRVIDVPIDPRLTAKEAASLIFSPPPALASSHTSTSPAAASSLAAVVAPLTVHAMLVEQQERTSSLTAQTTSQLFPRSSMYHYHHAPLSSASHSIYPVSSGDDALVRAGAESADPVWLALCHGVLTIGASSSLSSPSSTFVAGANIPRSVSSTRPADSTMAIVLPSVSSAITTPESPAVEAALRCHFSPIAAGASVRSVSSTSTASAPASAPASASSVGVYPILSLARRILSDPIDAASALAHVSRRLASPAPVHLLPYLHAHKVDLPVFFTPVVISAGLVASLRGVKLDAAALRASLASASGDSAASHAQGPRLFSRGGVDGSSGGAGEAKQTATVALVDAHMRRSGSTVTLFRASELPRDPAAATAGASTPTHTSTPSPTPGTSSTTTGEKRSASSSSDVVYWGPREVSLFVAALHSHGFKDAVAQSTHSSSTSSSVATLSDGVLTAIISIPSLSATIAIGRCSAAQPSSSLASQLHVKIAAATPANRRAVQQAMSHCLITLRAPDASSKPVPPLGPSVAASHVPTPSAMGIPLAAASQEQKHTSLSEAVASMAAAGAGTVGTALSAHSRKQQSDQHGPQKGSHSYHQQHNRDHHHHSRNKQQQQQQQQQQHQHPQSGSKRKAATPPTHSHSRPSSGSATTDSRTHSTSQGAQVQDVDVVSASAVAAAATKRSRNQ